MKNILSKISSKIEKSKLIRNPKFLIAGLIVIIAIITLIYFVFLKYNNIMNFEYEGYAVSGKDVTRNLTSGNENADNINLIKVEKDEMLSKKLNNYFVGNKEKTEININYPIYANDNGMLINLSENMQLITKGFERVDGYKNINIVEGKIYNGNDLQRADDKDYIFAETKDGIFVNLTSIKINTISNEYQIPTNSYIYMTVSQIRYYEKSYDKLLYKEINDVQEDTQITIGENTYTYKELLIKLNVIVEENNENTTTETNSENEENTSNNETHEEPLGENEVIIEEAPADKENDANNSEEIYVKPEVSCTEFQTEVYSTKTEMTINDPAGKIIEAPTFELYKENKIYLRKSATASGTFEITGLEPEVEYKVTGKYIYLSETGAKIENTFYTGTITTKGYDSLGTITFEKEEGDLYSSRIEIKNLKISSDINAEAIKGIAKGEIIADDIKTVIGSGDLRKLIKGETVVVRTSEGLKSNSEISYELKLYDQFGKELNVSNSTGKARTSKEAPTVKITVQKQDIISATLSLELTNKDKVDLENYRYSVTKPNGAEVKTGTIDKNSEKLIIEDLDPNLYYRLRIYADYDLGDNKGLQKDVEIGNLVFVTQSLTTLGSVEINVENKELGVNNSTITYQINTEKTDERLLQILGSLTVNLKQDENVIDSFSIEGEELERLKNSEIKEVTYNNLDSNTKYTINIEGTINLGTKSEDATITYSYKEFTTNKMPAQIQIVNKFITNNIIDFDVRVEDIDKSVLTEKVRMEIRDESRNIIDVQEIDTNKDFIRKTVSKLEENKEYTIEFFADQYNEGSTDATYVANYLINQVKIKTEAGISGDIGLLDVNRKATGKNLCDMSSETKWYVYPNFNTNDYYGKEYNSETKILKIGGNNNYRRAVYNLEDYVGQTVTISFKGKLVGEEGEGIYLQNSNIDANRTKIEGLTNEWKDFSYTVDVDSTGYLGFYIAGGDGIEIEQLQIELGSKKTLYEEFSYVLESKLNVNLEDRRDEIVTKDYYIKLYENDNLIKTDRYEEIDDNGKVTNAIKIYEALPDKKYKAELIIKLNEREYILSTVEFETEGSKEIKGIYNRDDFLEIQPNAEYIVLGDIDLSGGIGNEYTFGNEHFEFNGKINFNGHSLIKDTANEGYQVIYSIGENGIIENLVLDVYINGTKEMAYKNNMEFTKVNYGEINNVMINFRECTKLMHSYILALVYINYGIVNNFIVNFEVPVYEKYSYGVLFYENYGKITNGYFYGAGIEEYTSNKYSGTFYQMGYWNYGNGLIENVYFLSGINVNISKDGRSVYNAVGALSGNSIVRNIYSVDTDGSIQNRLYGPNVGTLNSATAENIYYFADKTLSTETSSSYREVKGNKTLLRNEEFQNRMLNSSNAFNMEDTVNRDYYPHLYMPSCMPTQEYIYIPEAEDRELIDVLNAEETERQYNEVTVKFTIHNPNAETIKEINIENVDCKILSQTYDNGESEVIALLNNPKTFKSEYQIKSIKSNGAFGIETFREYEEGERLIYVDFYREIYTIDDWKKMNTYLSDNFMLMNDLDFTGQDDSVCIALKGTFTRYDGKFNGNNYTIRNIDLDKSLFYYTYGATIKNLYVENYNLELHQDRLYNFQSVLNGGLITAGSRITLENVHIKNETINASYDKSSTGISLGGLVASGSGTIKNCSVTNLDIKSTLQVKGMTIGGICGTFSGGTMENTYVQNFNIYENNAIENNGIGGIIGLAGTTGSSNSYVESIKNVYAIGSITTKQGKTGGIIGQGSNLEVLNSYSNVYIMAGEENVGGIIGVVKEGIVPNTVKNNLSIGNIFSETGINAVSAIVGNVNFNTQNYAYSEQIINGERTKNFENNIFTYEEIMNKDTYSTKLNYTGIYEVQDNVLPKLYYSNQTILLPNQVDNTISKNELIIDTVYAEKTGDITLRGSVIIDSPRELNINGLLVDGMDTTITKVSYQNGKIYINFDGAVNKFYDYYIIYGVTYLENEHKVTENIEGKIQLQFFKEIYNYEDWQEIDTTTYQNYRIMNDLDFSGKTDLKYNLLVNNLTTDGQVRTLKNINFKCTTAYSGLIRRIRTSMQNIRFENVTITNPAKIEEDDSSSGGGSVLITFGTVQRDGTSLISRASGTIENCEFNNISITAPDGEGIGVISVFEAGTIKNISLDDIYLESNKDIGGFISEFRAGTVDNITVKNVEINARYPKGSAPYYIGGVFATMDGINQYNVTNIQLENINIKGRGSYVGGLVGQFTNNYIFNTQEEVQIRNITMKDSSIIGDAYVGGIAGVLVGGENINVENISIESNKDAFGVAYQFAGNNVHVKDVNIIGTSAGGIASLTRGAGVENSSVTNSTIQASKAASGAFGSVSVPIKGIVVKECNITGSTQAGGLANTSNGGTIADSFVLNSTIKGNSEVGGIISNFTSGTIRNTYNNSTIKATSDTAGGIVGKLNNANMTEYTNISNIYNNYVAGATIEAPRNAGGFIGDVGKELNTEKDYYYSNYIEADVSSTGSVLASLGIAGRPNQNAVLKDTYYYKYSKINGENPNIENEQYIPEESYLLEEQLKDASTYTEKLKWISSEWNFNVLQNNKYPLIQSEYLVTEQEGIDIPKDSENNIEALTQSTSRLLAEHTFEYDNKIITTYPTFSVITEKTDKANSAIRNCKLYEKDSKLYVVPTTLNAIKDKNTNETINIIPVANNLILDTYNGKEYETVLGTDGKIYDLKTPIKYPNDFKNSDIESIGNNLNTDSKEIEVTYTNGDVVKFNYQTGEILTSNMSATEENLFNYIKDSISNITDNSTKVSDEYNKKYEESKKLEEKLVETPVEEAISIENSNEKMSTNNNKKYVSIYNEETQEYEVYSEEEVLNTSKGNIVSENEKIKANNLAEFYASETKINNINIGILWISLSIIGAGIVLIMLRKNLKKRNK